MKNTTTAKQMRRFKFITFTRLPTTKRPEGLIDYLLLLLGLIAGYTHVTSNGEVHSLDISEVLYCICRNMDPSFNTRMRV